MVPIICKVKCRGLVCCQSGREVKTRCRQIDTWDLEFHLSGGKETGASGGEAIPSTVGTRQWGL